MSLANKSCINGQKYMLQFTPGGQFTDSSKGIPETLVDQAI